MRPSAAAIAAGTESPKSNGGKGGVQRPLVFRDGPVRKCGICGKIVRGHCRACYTRMAMVTGMVMRNRFARDPDGDLSLQLEPEHAARYAEVAENRRRSE
jgi:hypothetical protein